MSFLSNRLQYETSPYLLQHAQNPVDWYPWGSEAFQKARKEDKPIFLSIGYSTCHWCHVMAHESFEDEKTAGLLNRYFICIKVDKEERPDIDSIYMAVCQAFTGSGGWPTSIFMDAGQRPFFAGTYFPKESQGGMTGFGELLQLIHEQWVYNRPALISRAKQLVAQLRQDGRKTGQADTGLLETAAASYRRIYDPKNGGFGRAPKFPAPHQLLFLLSYYERRGDAACLQMAEQTLLQLYRGGLYDHIGSGFCRYSTDDRFLVPHFEKMLYDNALLILAYCKAYALTKKPLYLLVAERTAGFILREMASPSGGFYSAQDADSGGEEGKYYLFTPQEIIRLLGREDGKAFCRHFGISEGGNFEGKSIPNLLGSDPMDRSFDKFLEPVRQYRRQRCPLQLDDKILTAWNALMMAALCRLYQLSQNRIYWEAAKRADRFIQENLYEDGALFVSFRAGKRGKKGFLDDYAAYLFAQLALYEASLDQSYLTRAKRLCEDVLSRFQDPAGGFYLYGGDSEPLILRPKETYDGALPSGNSLIAWNLVRLNLLFPHDGYGEKAKRQLDFLTADAMQYPPGYAMFLLALLDSSSPPPKVTAVLAQRADADRLPFLLPPDTVISLLDKPEEGFPLKDGRTTFYICKNHSCLPPVNGLKGLL